MAGVQHTGLLQVLLCDVAGEGGTGVGLAAPGAGTSAPGGHPSPWGVRPQGAQEPPLGLLGAQAASPHPPRGATQPWGAAGTPSGSRDPPQGSTPRGSHQGRGSPQGSVLPPRHRCDPLGRTQTHRGWRGGWGSPPCRPVGWGGHSPEELQVVPAVAHQPLLVPLQPQRPQPLAHAGHGAHATARLAQRLRRSTRAVSTASPRPHTPADPRDGTTLCRGRSQTLTPSAHPRHPPPKGTPMEGAGGGGSQHPDRPPQTPTSSARSSWMLSRMEWGGKARGRP